MKYNGKEMWILTEETWYGGAGIIFTLLRWYLNKKAQKEAL